MRVLPRLAALACLLLLLLPAARADEGLWLPLLLQQLNEADMQKKGLQLTAEQIYSVNQGSLKDAVVQFGGGCTGAVISDQGLLLTNYHCGLSAIQRHSSAAHDYLTAGYWASANADELPGPGLTATFIIRMENVTAQVLMGVPTTGLTEGARELLTQQNGQRVAQAAAQGTPYQAFVRPFYEGNEYYLFVAEVFTDIRLVGAPPGSIGRFGGETDNWVWPRHTGDFALFRIYAGPDNQPAPYSLENKPFKPRRHLSISLAGVQPGDFTLVYGFPGSTSEYLTSYGVEEIYAVSDPTKVAIRTAKLQLLDAAMRASDPVRLQYAAKYAALANYWKKWQGELRGLGRLDAVGRKRAQEVQFQQWAGQGDAARRAAYAGLLPDFARTYAARRDYALALDYVTEAALGVELVRYAASLLPLADLRNAPDRAAAARKAMTGINGFFKNYSAPTDQQVAAALLPLYADNTPGTLLPDYVKELQKQYPGKGRWTVLPPTSSPNSEEAKKNIVPAINWTAYVQQFYATSKLTTPASAQAVLDQVAAGNVAALTTDPAYLLAAAIVTNYQANLLPPCQITDEHLTSLSRTYQAGLRQFLPNQKFYSDANSTLRVAYGEVAGYDPSADVHYAATTTLDGLMEKADPANPDYQVPPRLAALFAQKDYGPYARNGTVPVAFVATNHTTGGNSGSPVLNGRGELIGLNFDRNWEGTVSDIMFDPAEVRNITLDVRYFLFFGGQIRRRRAADAGNDAGRPAGRGEQREEGKGRAQTQSNEVGVPCRRPNATNTRLNSLSTAIPTSTPVLSPGSQKDVLCKHLPQRRARAPRPYYLCASLRFSCSSPSWPRPRRPRPRSCAPPPSSTARRCTRAGRCW